MMINHIITSSLVIVFVLLIGTIFENKISACMKYSLWLLVAVKLLLPIPGVESKIHIMNYIRSFPEVAKDRIEMLAEEDLLLDETLVTADNTSEQSNHRISHDFGENLSTDMDENQKPDTIIVDEIAEKTNGTTTVFAIIKGVYLAGVFGTLSVIIISNLRFSRGFKKKRKYVNAYKGKIEVYKIDDYYGACLYGGFSPVIIVGNNTNLSAEQQDMILLHEYVHYAHGDHIWSMIRNLCVALYWYNPLVWLAASVSRKDGELACDEDTIKRLEKNKRNSYGQTLLEVVSNASKINDITSAVFLSSTTATSGRKEMKKRISVIAKGRKTSRMALILEIILSVVCIGCTFGEPMKEDVPGTDSSASVQNIESNDFQGSDVTEDDFAAETILEADEITEKYANVYDKPQKDKICILIQPSELREQLNYYYIPEDEVQEELKNLLDNTELLSEEEQEKTKGKLGFSCSWSLEYNDKQYQVFESGYMLGTDMKSFETLFYKQNPELIDKVNNLLVQELNYEIIDIETISNLISATLSVKDFRTDHKLCKQTITDKNKLKNLEQWFRNAKRVSGAYDCGNNGAELLLKTASGEDIEMSLAADDCTIFAVNGIYYDYRPADKVTEGWYSNQVFDLFDEIPNAFEEDTNVELKTKTFVWPTESKIISNGFGERIHPITGQKKSVDYIGIAGNMIGLMGKSGTATRPFLSLSVKVNGEAVDPMLYFETDFLEETIIHNGKEYKKSELCNATLQWLELSELERSYSSYFPPEFMIFDETWGVTLTAEDITSTGVTINCIQANGQTTGELQTGSWYILETWTKEKGWMQLPYIIDGEIGWTDEAWIIPMNDTCEWDVDWEWLYGAVPSGKYRIGKSIDDFRATGDFDTKIYYAEFEIKK